MSEITWIKLKTDMFDNEKIKLIEALPDADTLIVIWVKLLTFAGRANAGGYIMLTENIPMNTEEMATIFNRPLNTVRLAIQTFERYGMIYEDDGIVKIRNWDTHQNIEGMERAKLLNAERNRKYRERKKQENLLLTKNSDVSVTSHDATELEEELDIDIEKEKEREKERKESRKQVYDEDSPSLILANYFYKQILKNDPKRRKPNMQKWADDIRKIIEIDKRDKKEIGELMKWVQEDDFERANVLSPSKLRDRYTALLLKMKKPKPSNSGYVEPPVYERSTNNGIDDEQHPKEIGNVRLYK